MYTIILCAIIGIWVGLYTTKDDCSTSALDYVANSFFAGSLGLVIGVVMAYSLPSETTTKITVYELHSLNDNQSVSGSFFLGYGLVDNEIRFTYYYKSGDYYRLGNIKGKDANIIYKIGVPRIEFYEEVLTDDFMNRFTIHISKPYYWIVIYVPHGSIKNDFNLDGV